jgi:hypothetical protein
MGSRIFVPLRNGDRSITNIIYDPSIMANERLGKKNIDMLLSHYRSERKRLNFQLERVRAAITDLKAAKARTEENSATSDADGVVKRGPGRPRKNPDAPAAPRKRKKRVVAPGGYRLSNWDEMILETIRKADNLLPKEDLLKASLVWAKKNEPKMKAAEVDAKLTRVLQKLSGKRGDLGTHRSGLRRGYHYGLKEWFFATSGRLRRERLEKLDL